MNTAAAVSASSAPKLALASDKPNQYLAFRVGEQEYAIDILDVHEIRGHTPITVLPQTPGFVRGAMNLRGTIVPVYDVRDRFGLGSSEYHRFSVIIIVVAKGRQIGLLVDAVSDVVELKADQIKPPPEMGVTDGFVQALGRIEERLLIILDLPRIVA